MKLKIKEYNPAQEGIDAVRKDRKFAIRSLAILEEFKLFVNDSLLDGDHDGLEPSEFIKMALETYLDSLEE